MSRDHILEDISVKASRHCTRSRLSTAAKRKQHHRCYTKCSNLKSAGTSTNSRGTRRAKIPSRHWTLETTRPRLLRRVHLIEGWDLNGDLTTAGRYCRTLMEGSQFEDNSTKARHSLSEQLVDEAQDLTPDQTSHGKTKAINSTDSQASTQIATSTSKQPKTRT